MEPSLAAARTVNPIRAIVDTLGPGGRARPAWDREAALPARRLHALGVARHLGCEALTLEVVPGMLESRSAPLTEAPRSVRIPVDGARRFAEFMDDFSIYIVQDDYAPLKGMAAYLQSRLGGQA